MRDEHIISILESAPLAKLGEGELAAVRAHTARCAGCRRAYEAAQISSLLLKERAAHEVEPSPFFQTRVLAALRERRAAGEAWSLKRMWKAAGALVSSMAAAVAVLAGLTFTDPNPQPPAEQRQDVASAFVPYSAEEVIFTQGNVADDEISYGQVLTTLYEAEDDAER